MIVAWLVLKRRFELSELASAYRSRAKLEICQAEIRMKLHSFIIGVDRV